MPLPSDLEVSKPWIGFHVLDWGTWGSGIGQSLSILCIIIWCLNIGIDVEEIVSLTRALVEMPIEASTKIMVADGHKEGLTKKHVWKSTTMKRKVYCLFLMVCKSIVALSLMFCGVLFLAFTITVSDLLLNAAALIIVLELDELFFKSLAPRRARDFLGNLNPIPQPAVWSRGGLNKRPVLHLLFMFVVVIVVEIGLLEPQGTTLWMARDEVCGGHLDFLAAPDQSGVIIAANVSSHQNRYSYQQEAIRELVSNGMEGANRQLLAIARGVTGGGLSLSGRVAMDLQTTSDLWNPLCQDMLKEGGRSADVFPRVLNDAGTREVKTWTTVTICSEIQPFCNNDSILGVRARQICPETCGCNDPSSDLVLTQESGCPSQCTQTEQYLAVRKSRACLEDGSNSPDLMTYLRGLQEVSASWSTEGRAAVAFFSEELQRDGCGVVKKSWFPKATYPWKDLCEDSGGWLVKPFTYACPISCNCSQNPRPLCPDQCSL